MCDCKCSCSCDKRENTVEEAIDILKAFKEGKTLQKRYINSSCSDWGNRDIRQLSKIPNFKMFQYRVKQEPRSLYVLFTNDGDVWNSSFKRKDMEEQASQLRRTGWYVKEFVEKL